MTARKTQAARKQAAQNRGRNREKRSSEVRKPTGKVEVVPAKPTLGALAGTANREHVAVIRARDEFVEHAIKAGEALIEAKAQVKHGEWRAWLEDHFDASERTAQIYMRVAGNPQSVADLEEPSLTGALRAIRAAKGSAETKTLNGDLLDEAKAAREEADEEDEPSARQCRAVSRLVAVTDSDEIVVELIDAVVAVVEAIDQEAALEQINGLVASVFEGRSLGGES